MLHMATANNFAIHSAEVDIPYRRIWLALLTFTDDQGPVTGDAVTLVIGSWTAHGTCIDAGPHGGIYEARVVAGAGGWRQLPTGLALQNDANLTRADVATALASSVGETVEADPDTLGVHWSFDSTISAGANLDQIADWYVRDDGVTVLGTRSDGAEFRTIVDKFDGKRGDADLLLEEQDVARVLPGALITSDSLSTSILVRHTRILLSPNELRVEVQPQEQDILRGARHEARKLRFLGTYRYRIIEQIADRLQLQAVNTVDGLPDQLLVDKAHGLPGVTTECTEASEVLIVFADGKQSQPFVSAYLGASNEEVHTTGSAVFTTSAPLPTVEPVALAPAVDDIKAALLAACTAVATDPTTAGIVGAFAGLSTALGAIQRTGSIVLEAQ